MSVNPTVPLETPFPAPLPSNRTGVISSAVITDATAQPFAAAHLTIPKPHLASLDGLRGLACLMVVCHHCWFHAGWYPVQLGAGVHRWNIAPLLFGRLNVGVDLFFALSGFCLSAPLIRGGPDKWDWGRYFARRCKRILPPFWIACTVFAVLHFAIEALHIRPLTGHILVCETNRQLAYTFALLGFSMNGSFWTLPVEWRWYFALPVLMILWKRAGTGWAALVIAAAVAGSAVLYRGGGAHSSCSAFYRPSCRSSWVASGPPTCAAGDHCDDGNDF